MKQADKESPKGAAKLLRLVQPGSLEVVHQRFCYALLIHESVALLPKSTFAAKLLRVQPMIKATAGDIESLLADAAQLTRRLSRFCQELRWSKQARAVSSMLEKLSNGAPDELAPLIRSSERVNASVARQLYEAGFDDAEALARASTDAVFKALSAAADYVDHKPNPAAEERRRADLIVADAKEYLARTAHEAQRNSDDEAGEADDSSDDSADDPDLPCCDDDEDPKLPSWL